MVASSCTPPYEKPMGGSVAKPVPSCTILAQVARRFSRLRLPGVPDRRARFVGETTGAHDIAKRTMVLDRMPGRKRQFVHRGRTVIQLAARDSEFGHFQRRRVFRPPRYRCVLNWCALIIDVEL